MTGTAPARLREQPGGRRLCPAQQRAH